MTLKEKLRTETPTIGSWITLAHPAIAEIMARAGVDWLTVDLEHSVITIREAEELIRIIALCGVTPLVRPTSNDAAQMKRVLDAGAHGVIVPNIQSSNDVKKIVDAVYYPIQGQRGVGLARAQGYGSRFKEYLSWVKRDPIIVVMIEHIDAIQNLSDIFSISEVDAYVLGPYDLSSSMGIPGNFTDSKFCEAIEQIKKIAHQYKKPGGLHIIEPDPAQLEKTIEKGFRFIPYSLDIRMLDVTCRVGVDRFFANREHEEK